MNITYATNMEESPVVENNDFDIATPDKGSQPSESSNAGRRRSLSPLEWENARPHIEQLYMNMGMTLREVALIMETEHGFSATEQMYKKRIRVWGLTKHTKAEEKDQALEKLLHQKTTTSVAELAPIRHDKLVRYAKTRVKRGSLDSSHLKKILKRSRHRSPSQQQVYPIVVDYDISKGILPSLPQNSTLPRHPDLPDGFADFDRFLKAMQSLIQKEREEWLAGPRLPPDAIFQALANGLTCWRKDESSNALRLFSLAAQTVTEDLQQQTVSVLRIAYCVSSIIWGTIREPIFLQFAQFMANSAVEKLGPRCPLTIVLQHIQKEQSLDAQLAIWACALDDYQISEDNREHWWNMAQRRWQWCRRSGFVHVAVRYCVKATSDARVAGQLTPLMEFMALSDLTAMRADAASAQAQNFDELGA